MDPNLLMMLAATEGAEHATPNLFPDPGTFIWTIINFVILLWALHRFLYKPLLGAIAAREQEIESALRKSREDREEAERLRRDFESQIANAQREAHDIITKATKAAVTAKEQIEAETRAKTAEMLENASKSIEREKAKAIAELREEVASLAVAVAGKVIEKNLDNAEQKRLAERFVAEVGKH
ncbi:MAG TPA: F0F1 ATP synthase subunit B [Symbiobacteriaceae bacterium]|nr:F0F1 ATP synthase subunit B [Symbiobacteriaceae bacterium]